MKSFLREDVVTAFRADEPDASTLQRAYVRFSWTRRRSTPPLRLLRWVALGILVGLGGASAATLLPHRLVSGEHPVPVVSVRARAQRHAPLRAERAVAPSPSAPDAHSTARSIASAPLSAPPAAPQPAVAKEPESSNGEWARVAQALRASDFEGARAALSRLKRSANTREREAAELAEAQLLVKAGDRTSPRSTLVRLSRDALSPLVRAQANALLNEVSK